MPEPWKAAAFWNPYAPLYGKATAILKVERLKCQRSCGAWPSAEYIRIRGRLSSAPVPVTRLRSGDGVFFVTGPFSARLVEVSREPEVAFWETSARVPPRDGPPTFDLLSEQLCR